MQGNIVLDMSVGSGNYIASDTVQSLINQAVTQTVEASPTQPPPRPSRASKQRAMNKIKDIHAWENCSEQSRLFKAAEEAINAEFDALHPEERADMHNDSESEYSEESAEEQDNLSFVDPESEQEDENAEWSAAESEPPSETEESEEEEESEDDEEQEIPSLIREPAGLDSLPDGLQPSQQAWVDDLFVTEPPLPTQETDDLDSPVIAAMGKKRKRVFQSDSEEE